nr:unnamed protein product [Callosobruchus chinensis]
MSTPTPTPEEIKAEYASSLADLTFNSRPLINVLTMLAEENSSNAKVIVEAIETHLQKSLPTTTLWKMLDRDPYRHRVSDVHRARLQNLKSQPMEGLEPQPDTVPNQRPGQFHILLPTTRRTSNASFQKTTSSKATTSVDCRRSDRVSSSSR